MSLRQAINAKCKECIYDPHQAGGWKQQVQACTSPKCPLFPVRPVSGSKNGHFAAILDSESDDLTLAGKSGKAGETK